nr:immunoglobulin heavy chain junction region [Macaca mulatta]
CFGFIFSPIHSDYPSFSDYW